MAEIETKKFFEPLNMGVGVLIVNKNDEILMGVRTSPSGFGLLGLPGGTKDACDANIFMTALRELAEESGINEAKIIRLFSIDDSTVQSQRYLNFGVLGVTDQEPRVVDVNEICEWKWFPLNNLPLPEQIFEPSWITIQCYLEKKIQINSPSEF